MTQEQEQQQEWRAMGALPEGVEGAVWDELERGPDKYGKGPDGNIDRTVIIKPGRPKATIDNIALILELDSRWRGAVRFNRFRNVIEAHGEPLSDRKEIELLRWLDQTYMLNASPAAIHNGIIGASSTFEYHPLQDYLSAVRVQWDGQQRVPYWLSRYLGVEQTELSEAIATRFMISCVARAFAELPKGCKVDTTLILVGKQGARKSTALAALIGREWFSDSAIDLRNPKDAMAQLVGVWLHEFAELDSIAPRDITTVKAFLTAQVDKYRPAYGRNTIEIARQCVFAGTTNNEGEGFLRDPTGSRRFWPIEVGDIDIDGLEEARDQLWGEAVAMYQAGVQWWLDEDEAGSLINHNLQFQMDDVWAGPVFNYLNAAVKVKSCTTAELLEKAIGVEADKQHTGYQRRVGGIMTNLGWLKKRRTVDGARVHLWVRPESEDA